MYYPFLLLQGEKGNNGAMGLQGEPGPKVNANEVEIPGNYLTIIPFASNKREWNNCFIKKSPKNME